MLEVTGGYVPRFRGSLMLCIAALVCQGQTGAPARTDVAPPPSARFPASWYPPDNSLTSTEAPQTGAPYSATLVITSRFLNLATGKVEAVSRSTFQARDGDGRRRDEVATPRADSSGKIVNPHVVSVSDPVSHCRFQWMEPWVAPGKPTAAVTCMPRTLNLISQNIYAEMTVTEPREVRSPAVLDRFEPLGRRLFGDLEAVGTRHTRTPAKSQTGENRELIEEIWYAPDLKELLVMKEISAPGAEEKISAIHDFELKDIHRGEPNPELFYPPDGYQIKSGN